MKILQEFKEFAIRGNVMDMAVGIIMGAAFGTVVKSLVNDVVMPPIGFLKGKVNFEDLFINLSGGSYPSLAAAKEAGATTINYGLFINNVISLLIVAFCVFFLVRWVNNLKRSEDVKSVAPTQKSCAFCFMSISIKATRCPHCTSELEA